jgi:hypothetical protein
VKTCHVDNVCELRKVGEYPRDSHKTLWVKPILSVNLVKHSQQCGLGNSTYGFDPVEQVAPSPVIWIITATEYTRKSDKPEESGTPFKSNSPKAHQMGD